MDAWLSRRALLSGAVGGGLIAAIPGAPSSAEAAAIDADSAAVVPGEARPNPVRLAIIHLVHDRRQWRARRPKRRIDVLNHGPDHIVIHHTATPNTQDLTLAHAFSLSRRIQHFHMNGRGWDDIGEQLTISRGGYVMEGRARSLSAIMAGRHVLGAQTLHHNSHTIGIEIEGTYAVAGMPVRQWSSLVRTCRLLCAVYGLDPFHAIVGHRDFNKTNCPGDVLYARLPALRRAVAAHIESPSRRRHPWR